MQESSTYQHILEEGRQEGRVRQTQQLVLRIARQRLGVPGKAIKAALLAITDLDRLERMSDRILHAADWNDLLGTP
jgi:predicted transposase YdaD